MTQQNQQQMMHAAAIDHFGGIETIAYQTLPMPAIEADEVLMRVESAGVGVWDTFEREGGFAKMFGTKPKFPYVLGSDGAGTIVAVGTDVKNLKIGDRIYALALANPKGGFYAQYIAVKAENSAKVPSKLSIEQAGVMPVDAITALMGLDDTLGLTNGQTIMIFGASGGIGHMAVQLAKRMGAKVFAVASGKDGVALVKKLGADLVVDGRSDDVAAEARKFAPDGIDAALVTAGGKMTDEALQALRDGARVAYPNGVDPQPKVRSDIKSKSYDGMPTPQTIKKLNSLIEAGPFEVHIARVFPLNQAAEAQRALEQHYLGKIALKPN
jgi:NADPH:quinone reductase-like Zn-dependent oxidoreductase